MISHSSTGADPDPLPPTTDDPCRNTSSSSSLSFSEEAGYSPPSFFEIIGSGGVVEWTELNKRRAQIKNRFKNVKSQLQKANGGLVGYRKTLYGSLNRMESRWNDPDTVTVREKVAFNAGVLNVFVSGILLSSRPEWFYLWYAAQLAYFLPVRYYTYKKRQYHYFLADLCYFVNFLLCLSIFVFPQSEALFISTFCLAFGNNAVAIAMWRNSLVFHSIDKVTSLFIHIMPCATLHTLVHLIPSELRQSRFPAIAAVTESPARASLKHMIICASVPYFIWQLSYHILITVHRREKIAAGAPTSFTWLRKSYSTTWIGRLVLKFPTAYQELAFMSVQYIYALGTMLPCPLWIRCKHASAAYLFILFVWSVNNGASYYMDVFGKRFKADLDELRKQLEQNHEDESRKSDGSSSSTTGRESTSG